MKKASLLFFALLMSVGWLAAQRSFEISVGTGMDFNVNFPEGTEYEPYTKGQMALWNFEVNVRIPIRRISLYPTFIYSIPYRNMLVRNPEGEYIPLGFGFTEVYSDGGGPGSSWIYSNDYETLSSEVDIWQMMVGSYFTFDLIAGFELGTGIFYRDKKTRIFDFGAYDEYYLIDGDGINYGEYLWDQTWEYPGPTELTIVRDRTVMVPLIAQYSYYTNGPFFAGGRFVYWLGRDPYFNLGAFSGVSF